MSEIKSSSEGKEVRYSRRDLTPFEHMMLGGTEEVQIRGEGIKISRNNIKALMMDEVARRVVLSPISLTQGKRTLEEVNLARQQSEEFTGFITIFEYDQLSRDIYPAFRAGDLDENGQIKTIKMYLKKEDQEGKIPLSLDMSRELPIGEDLRDLIEYVGNESDMMTLKIRDLKNN